MQKYAICKTLRNMRGNVPQAVFQKNLIFNLNIFNFWPGGKYHDFSRFSLNFTIFHDFLADFQIPWLFQVFQVAYKPWRRDESYIGKRVERMKVRGRKGRGRPKKRWIVWIKIWVRKNHQDMRYTIGLSGRDWQETPTPSRKMLGSRVSEIVERERESTY
jgi:hypothetical protein